MSQCRRTRDDRTQVITLGAHVDPLPDGHDDRCRGCSPCARRHCTSCTGHLQPDELQTCVACVGKVRRDLIATLDLAALLPDHALRAARNGRLAAALELPGGDALVMLSRGSEGLADDDNTTRADEPHPPSFVLAWWEEKWRDHLGLDSRRPPWQRRPARTLVEAYRFLDQHHNWAAQHFAGFHVYAADLTRLRGSLEELLTAGEQPQGGVACFSCGATLERDYRSPHRCGCGPRPRGGHIAHHRTDACCLGCANQLRWELAHTGHDQGGLADTTPHSGWHCPRCKRKYSPGEYQLAVRARHDEVAEYRRLDDAARVTGAKPGTVKMWASRGQVRKRRDESGRVTYHVRDIRARLAAYDPSHGVG